MAGTGDHVTPAPQWATDPIGKGKLRYWDGVAWTAYLSDGVRTYLDPEPENIPTNGVAGGSAQREHERRAARASTPSASSSAEKWQAGAIGEQYVARYLQETVGHSAILLHDRDVPGTRGNIDHLAVSRNGVWVIDTKNYTGAIDLRDRIESGRLETRLYVKGRDRTNLAEKMQWQVESVREVIGTLPINVIPAICFVNCTWRVLGPFRLRGVLITAPTHLPERINAPGPFERDVGGLIAARLNEAFPAK